MDIFFTLFENLLPLYVLTAIGYVAGRYLEVNLHSMAIVAIYILSPYVNFFAVSQMDLNPAFILLPFITFAISAGMILLTYRLSKLSFSDDTRNLIAMVSGSGNVGYFGYPLVGVLMGEEWLGPYMLMVLGIVISETTVGYYFGARGRFTVAQSLRTVARLPVLYGVIAGLAINLSGLPLPKVAETYWHHALGAMIIVGMMLIGIGLAKIQSWSLNLPLMFWLFLEKFAVWPLLVLAFLTIEGAFFHILGPEIRLLLVVMSIVPLPANSIAFAARLDLRPEEMATAVLASTVFALVYIPLVLSFVT